MAKSQFTWHSLGISFILLLLVSFVLAFFLKPHLIDKHKNPKPDNVTLTSEGLSTTFYDEKCSVHLAVVKKHVKEAMQRDPTVAAGILRMHFHDCWNTGCDASVLLDSTDNKTAPEKKAGPNVTLHGFQLIESIKSELERVCKGIVSCADILALVAREAVVQVGGPSWEVPLGRKDGRISNAANVQLPSPSANVSTLIRDFENKGLTPNDLVALSGAHTIGSASCSMFQRRFSDDSTMNATYARQLAETCGTNPRVPVDPLTQNLFDNSYYTNLQQGKGLFTSDEGLFLDSRTQAAVNALAETNDAFFSQFSESMFRMITLPSFQSNVGGIRSVCSTVDS